MTKAGTDLELGERRCAELERKESYSLVHGCGKKNERR